MNFPIFFIALVALHFENNYFGWNAIAKSDSEAICDTIIALIFALAWVGK